mmetsp:Transcript_16793/g.25411  ORF Transcript_16793/g.25411 Transcript_16793/m.25411 type:complete len:212 (-) Transcript_16793:507-1142(-)
MEKQTRMHTSSTTLRARPSLTDGCEVAGRDNLRACSRSFLQVPGVVVASGWSSSSSSAWAGNVFASSESPSAFGVCVGLHASDKSSQQSTSGSCSFGSGASLVVAFSAETALDASSMTVSFTFHMPSRSSTRYLGSQVPFAVSPHMAPRAVAHLSHSCQRGSQFKVCLLPMTIQPLLARVNITFNRRQSDKKPTFPSRLFRTEQKMITSFS